MWKSLISIKGKEKNELDGDFGSKLTLNHRSLVVEGDETRVFGDGSRERKGKERFGMVMHICVIYSLWDPFLTWFFYQ